jgi:hypothetical protein
MLGAMPPRNRLRLAHLVPLAGFLIPSVVIGYGFVLPRAGFSGINELTIGFATTLSARRSRTSSAWSWRCGADPVDRAKDPPRPATKPACPCRAPC